MIDEHWSESLKALWASDGIDALAIRDALARSDREQLATALIAKAVDDGIDASTRAKAVWLLKDLCVPAAAAPLAQILSGPATSQELRIQVLDVLERMAFAAVLPGLDLHAIATHVQAPEEVTSFVALLASIGSTDARTLLRQQAADAERRGILISHLCDHPGSWVDQFLEGLAMDHPHDERLAAALETRTYRRLEASLRRPDNHERISAAVLSQLWTRRATSLIASLAKQRRLDQSAATTLCAITPDETLSKTERKLLRDAQSAAAAIMTNEG